jgi:hypothetical protein
MPGTVERQESPAAGWTDFIEFLEQGMERHGSLPVYLRVLSGRFWTDCRVFRRLPVAAVEVGADTWEVRLLIPGLHRANTVGDSPLTLQELLSQLRSAADVASTFKFVLSDQLTLDRAGVLALATRRGNEWTGLPLSELGEDEHVGKYDVPLVGIQARPRRRHLELRARVVL